MNALPMVMPRLADMILPDAKLFVTESLGKRNKLKIFGALGPDGDGLHSRLLHELRDYVAMPLPRFSTKL